MDTLPEKQYSIGQKLTSVYHDETGVVEQIEWSVTFGQWTYLLRRTQDSRYGGKTGHLIWVCQSDLKVVET